MSSFVGIRCGLLCLLCCLIERRRVATDEIRPYEFSFNVVDFQHRYERKGADGLVTGEYGFITADGVYHETGYATDKKGDFIITRMRNRKITSLKDAEEIFKDRPEAARKLLEAVAKACGGCKIPTKQEEDERRTKPVKIVTIPPRPPPSPPPPRKKMEPIAKQMMKILSGSVARANTTSAKSIAEGRIKPKEDIVRDMVRAAKKLLSREDGTNDRLLEKMANDLYYRFDYAITTHGHREDGYRNGRKDGSYRSRGENGVDTRVTYLSNEFGHQPNITLVPGEYASDGDEHALKGYSFRWYW